MNKNYDNSKKLDLETKIKEYKDGYYIFEDTVFYGEKGGMDADIGTINGLPVIDLKWDGDTLLHKVDGELKDPIIMHVDQDNRFMNVAIQSAFHILDGYFLARGLYMPAVGCHQNNPWFEVPTKELTEEDLKQVEKYMNDAIESDVKVEYSYMNGKDYSDPKYQQYDELRIVTFKGLDSQPCGTPHVNSTKDIGSFVILDHEKTSKGVRVYCTVNKTTDAHLKNYYETLKETAIALGCKKEEAPQKASEMVGLTKTLKKELNDVKKELMDLKANSILASEDKIVKYETTDANDIRMLGQSLMTRVAVNKIIYTIINDEINFAIISPTNEARNILELVKKEHSVIGGGSPKIVTAKVAMDENAFIELVK